MRHLVASLKTVFLGSGNPVHVRLPTGSPIDLVLFQDIFMDVHLPLHPPHRLSPSLFQIMATPPELLTSKSYVYGNLVRQKETREGE